MHPLDFLSCAIYMTLLLLVFNLIIRCNLSVMHLLSNFLLLILYDECSNLRPYLYFPWNYLTVLDQHMSSHVQPAPLWKLLPVVCLAQVCQRSQNTHLLWDLALHKIVVWVIIMLSSFPSTLSSSFWHFQALTAAFPIGKCKTVWRGSGWAILQWKKNNSILFHMFLSFDDITGLKKYFHTCHQ